MKIIKNPTVEYKSEAVFKNFVDMQDDKVVLLDVCPKELAEAFYKIMPSPIIIIYEMSNPVCECGNKLHKHAKVEWKMDRIYPIYKYQYICPKCGKTIVTPLKDIVDKNCCYTVDTKNLVVNMYSNEHISYDNASKIINDYCSLNISKQTIFNYNDTETDEYLTKKEEIIEKKIEEENIDLTGFPGHDEAFFSVNGDKYSYLVMLDSNNQRIINDQFMPEDTYREFLEAFIVYSLKDLSVYDDPDTPNPAHPLLLPDLKKDTLTADGLKEYPGIAKKAGMDFHPCVFHKNH